MYKYNSQSYDLYNCTFSFGSCNFLISTSSSAFYITSLVTLGKLVLMVNLFSEKNIVLIIFIVFKSS